MRLYGLKTDNDRYIAEMDDKIIGAVDPGIDADYYDNLLIGCTLEQSKHILGMIGLLHLIKEGKTFTMSREEPYKFDPNTVKIVTFIELK